MSATAAAKEAEPTAISGRVIVRMTVMISVLVVLTCVALSLLLIGQHLREMRASVDAEGHAIGQLIARQGELGVLSGDVEALRELARLALAQRGVVSVRFYDRHSAELASFGDTRAASRSRGNVVEFRERVTTAVAARSAEELGFAAAPPGGQIDESDLVTAGWVAIGIGLDAYHERRRIAIFTAVGFTTLVIVLALASSILLTQSSLRSLAAATELAEERSRVARLKSDFVATASHEFRTPLAVILAASQVLQRYAGRLSGRQQEERLQKIQKAVRQMTDLLDDVLTVERAEARKIACVPVRVDIGALCGEIMVDVAGPTGDLERVALSVRGAPQEILLDPKLVRQIVRNLLTNALKYSPEGTAVEIDVECTPTSMRLRVTDHGIGIPQEDLPHLFEPFARAGNVGAIEGSGLGLAITRRAARTHGGTISVTSDVGSHTTFLVEIPTVPVPGAAETGT